MGESVVLIANPSSAQVKKGKTRPMMTKHLMRGLVSLHCKALKEELGAGPTSDKAWDSLEVHAALLNEASYILMDDGRCPE